MELVAPAVEKFQAVADAQPLFVPVLVALLVVALALAAASLVEAEPPASKKSAGGGAPFTPGSRRSTRCVHPPSPHPRCPPPLVPVAWDLRPLHGVEGRLPVAFWARSLWDLSVRGPRVRSASAGGAGTGGAGRERAEAAPPPPPGGGGGSTAAEGSWGGFRGIVYSRLCTCLCREHATRSGSSRLRRARSRPARR